MSCRNENNSCGCNFNIKSFGTHDLSKIIISGKNQSDMNFSELSVPEIVTVPPQKPDIEHLDQVYVDVIINRAKLIETPFAYKTYERLATAFEITAVTDAINLAVVDITPIVNAVNAILSIPLLPAIPAVAALQAALTGVTAAAASLTTAINDALAALALPCIAASLLITLLNSVSAAVGVLVAALNALIAAANLLITATSDIPIVGAAVAAAVGLLITAINTVKDLLTTALTTLLNAVILIGKTSYFAIIPNAEGTCLSGRKLIIEGTLDQKIVYTGLVTTQSVHSTCNQVPFTAYIIPYASFKDLTYEENVEVIIDPEGNTCDTTLINGYAYDPTKPIEVDLCEEFCINAYIEDIFAYAMDKRTVFKNITLFLLAKPTTTCN